MNTASGEARHTYVVSAADGTAAWNGLINWTFTAAASSTWTGDVRISFYKEAYDANAGAYVQYAGPYKPYSGSQLYASQAELKVTADGISSTVSKISGIKYFDTTYSYSLANIKTYSTNGYSGAWYVTTSTDGTRVGDVVYLKVHDTTRNCDVYIKGTVTTVNSSTRLTITSHGYEDTLPVDTIKSTINQSADSVKIQANHVDIEGAAIFTGSGRLSSTSLNNTYDSKGSAAAVQSNLDNLQIGGKNLVISFCKGYIQTTQNVTCTGTGPSSIRLDGTAAANGTPTTLIFRAPKLEPGKYSL